MSLHDTKLQEEKKKNNIFAGDVIKLKYTILTLFQINSLEFQQMLYLKERNEWKKKKKKYSLAECCSWNNKNKNGLRTIHFTADIIKLKCSINIH